jgi:predicted NAD/FAD-binding protein
MGISKPRKVAVVGGGLTGIASFWALQGSNFDVHLFEASPTLGGHMKTLLLENNGNQIQVDTELPIFNPIACPNLTSILRYLKIPTTEVPFSFGVLDNTSVFKWHISILKSIFLCPRLLCKLETYRLLLDVISLRCLAADILTEPISENAGLQDSTERYLQEKGYPNGFRDRYLTPLLSTLWRTNAGKFLPNLPVKVLAHSLHEHQLLSMCENMPKWRRIDPGVRYLVDAITRNFPLERLHLQTKVNEIVPRSESQYDLLTSDGKHSRFDHVILTVDGPEILRLLCSTVTEVESHVLQSLSVTRNIAVLHSDFPAITDHVAPDYEFIMASSNYRRRDLVPPKFCLRYDVNVLQDIPASRFGEVFITFNSLSPPHPSLVQGVWEFTEPEPSAESLGAQSRLALIQNTRGLSYGFCWTGRGLLEDSITSGLRIAVEDLGAMVPFDVAFHPHPLHSPEFSYKHSGLRYNLVRTALEAVRTAVLVLEIVLLLLGRTEAPVLKTRAPLDRASRI